jgi:hypothetical protein
MDRKLPAWLLRDKPPRKAAGYAKPWATDERKVPAWMQKRAPRRERATVSQRNFRESSHDLPREGGALETLAELLSLILQSFTIF